MVLPRGMFARASALAIGLVVLVPAGRAQAQERLTSFAADATLTADGTLHVHEQITWDFDGLASKHGIFRYVPERHRWDGARPQNAKSWERFERVTPVHFESVSSPTGAPANVATSKQGANRVAKIGSKKRTVNGIHTYVIDYRIEHAVVGGTLRYAVTGAGWTVPVERITVVLHAPIGGAVACGPVLACAQDGDRVSAQPSTIGTELVVPLRSGAITDGPPRLEPVQTLRRAFDWSGVRLPALGGSAAAALAAVAALARRGRDRVFESGPVAGGRTDAERARGVAERIASPVEFAPPEGVTPASAAIVRAQMVPDRAISATLIHLAMRGHLTIEADGTDHTLTQKTASGQTSDYERALLAGVFAAGPQVSLDTLKKTRALAKPIAGVKTQMLDGVVTDGWFTKRPDRAKGAWAAAGVVTAIVGGLVTLVLGRTTTFALLGLPIVLLGLGLIAISPTMPVRTAAGTRLRARLKGFEELFDAGEGERLAWAENKDLLVGYLPYAMVFGNVDKWAKRLAVLGIPAAAGAWYVGSRGFDHGSFTHSMDSFDAALSRSMTAQSSSSNGGGGGSSSGGGGGGSW